MIPTPKSCAVAFPMQRNSATFPHETATSSATATQQSSIKALAARVLKRNQQRNQPATTPGINRNFPPENNPQKLHGSGSCNHDATTRPLPCWCQGRACEHHHRLELPDLPTVEWCCDDSNGRHWRIYRIDRMKSCPINQADQAKQPYCRAGSPLPGLSSVRK